jgi:hypothetical protein
VKFISINNSTNIPLPLGLNNLHSKEKTIFVGFGSRYWAPICCSFRVNPLEFAKRSGVTTVTGIASPNHSSADIRIVAHCL